MAENPVSPLQDEEVAFKGLIMGGSSGGPIFDDEVGVCAMVHATGNKNVYNIGHAISSIFADIGEIL